MAIYSGFSHEKWWFSIAMLVHQRVTWICSEATFFWDLIWYQMMIHPERRSFWDSHPLTVIPVLVTQQNWGDMVIMRNLHYLVGGWATPLKKISQLGSLFPIYGKTKKCSKPPTSYIILYKSLRPEDGWKTSGKGSWGSRSCRGKRLTVSGSPTWPNSDYYFTNRCSSDLTRLPVRKTYVHPMFIETSWS